MSKQNTNSPAKLSKILSGSFPNLPKGEKFTPEQKTLLTDNEYNYLQGTIVQAGPVSDGTFNVQFNSGTTGYSDAWPKWAYEAARDALLHGWQVMVIHNRHHRIRL